jgi:D-alanine transaminase
VIVFLNGKFVPLEEAKISVLDRGFIFGDAVYEVWRSVGGKLFETERHLARLASGLRDLRIAPPAESLGAGLHAVADRLMKENGLTSEGSLFLEISRGVAPRSHAYPNPAVAPTVFIMAAAFTPPEELRARGAAVILIDDVRWKRCNVKTTQLLPNVMAKQSAFEHDALDAIFVRDGMVTETSHANVMAVIDGTLWTHPVDGSVLPGVTREVVLEIARAEGIPVREAAMTRAQFLGASEVFLVGTLSDVMPIVKVDDKTVGAGKPGAVTRQLFGKLRARLDATAGKTLARA